MALPLQLLSPIFEAMHAGHLVLTPNHRMYIQLLEGYGQWRQSRSLSSVCNTPTIYPIDIWLRRQWTEHDYNDESYLKILDPAHEAMVWHDIIQRSDHGAALINKQATAKAVQEAWQTAHLYEIDFEELYRIGYAQQQPEYAEDFSVFVDWVKTFAALCQKHDVISLSPLVEKVIARLKNGAVSAPAHVVVAGFGNPPPLYARLIHALENSAQSFTRFKAEKPTPKCDVIPCADLESEMVRAAQWVKDCLQQDETASIAIICQEKNRLSGQFRKILNDIFSDPHSINLKNGDINHNLAGAGAGPLINTPIIEAALSILRLNTEWAETLSLCHVLRSPFLAEADSENCARAELEYVLRRSGELKIRMAWVHELAAAKSKPTFSEKLGQNLVALASLRRQLPRLAASTAWAELFEKQLETMGWPGERTLDRNEILLLQEWSKVLRIYKECTRWLQPHSLPQALSWIRSLLSASSTVTGSYQARIQVLSPTEADGIFFTHTWVMGLSEQQWPPIKKPTPFIPVSLQKKAGITDSDIKEQAAQALEQLNGFASHAGKKIIFSYPCQDGDLLLKPSMQLRHFDEALLEKTASPQLSALEQTLGGFSGHHETEDLEETPFITVTDSETLKGSVSLVANQADCPFKAFALHRLNSRRLPEPAVGLSASAFGSILHEVMQRFWQVLKDQASLTALTDQDINELLDEVVTASLTSISRFYPYTMTATFQALEKQRLIKLLRSWIEEERKRGAFSVLETEKKVSWQHASLKFDLRIDRLDLLPDGKLVLVDYKSGKNSEINWRDERQTEPQLMLYSQAVEAEGMQSIEGLFISQIHIDESRYKGISNSDDIYPGSHLKNKQFPDATTWSSLRKEWERTLSELVNEFMNGFTLVAPKSYNSCTYCHLQAFCRINVGLSP